MTDIENRAAEGVGVNNSHTDAAALLLKKPAQRKSFTVSVTHYETGEEVDVEITVRAVGAERWDELVEEHPPSEQDKNEGHPFNTETFLPALMAESLVNPAMTVEQVTEMFHSPDWSGGELGTLTREVMSVNQKGLNVPFTDSGSGRIRSTRRN